MRSRTLGKAKVKQLASVYGVSEDVLKIHNDQYLPTDFSIVITLIGNAFFDILLPINREIPKTHDLGFCFFLSLGFRNCHE